MMFRLLSTGLALLVCLAAGIAHAVSPAEWRSRTIYQLLTDRFNNPNGGTCNLSNYCGGTWRGIIDRLDYIQSLGFDAIWISPVVENTPGGYHGYWAMNLYEVNSHFGTKQDLKDLVEACHKRGIWVMADVVANHMGPGDISSFVPFNSESAYHDCSICPPSCQIQDWNNQPEVQHCKLSGLPDLNQTAPWVANNLTQWINSLVNTYGFDGIRVDTVPEVNKPFWKSFNQAAGVYAVGEVYNGNIQYVSGYQSQALDAVLSYPMFFTLRNVFANKQSMYNLQSTVQAYSAFPDTSLLGSFLDNHDQVRFLNVQPDYSNYRNALLYLLLSEGIPIVYYGTEQGFHGAADPNNREPLWPTNFASNNPLFSFLQQVIAYRKKAQVWNYSQVQRYADDEFYAFTRGTTFVALTNTGSNGGTVHRTITYQPYEDGTKLCNLFYPDSDCLTVENGQFDVYLVNGQCKVYYPVA